MSSVPAVRPMAVLSLFLLLVVAVVSHATNSFKARCLAFQPEKYIFNSTRTELHHVPAGTNLTFPYNDPTCNRASQVVSVDLCRVALSIPTSPRSSITYEMWLPESWTGRFLATGNGGIDGCIKYEDISYGTSNGFVAIGTNNGHNGTYGNAFYRNDDTVTDFAWRSLHASVTAGKKLTKLFYGKDFDTSYYIGCSLGGRQGIKSAEMFPGDFDGIVAGSPAVDFNNLYSWRASFFPITGAPGSEDFISATTWKTTIHDEVLGQCDGIDGVLDGIIENPTLCHFKPEMLLCGTINSSDCLNMVQVGIVKQIFSPFLGLYGELIFPAMQPGSEVLAADGLYAGKPFSFSEDWFKYVIWNPSWNASTFNLTDALVADIRNPANIRTYPSTIEGFRRRGGKVLSFHGQQDNQITSFNTQRFYHHLGSSYSISDMDEFFRFFRISGMFHCSSGPGAWVLGQGGGAPASGIPFNRTNNVLAAVVDWVEQGIAPETITGTKFVNDTVSLGTSFTRRHCKYPLNNTYLGDGKDPSEPSSWDCM